MSNTLARASKWTHFLASRAEFPAGERLLAAFHAGKITRLCDCGCDSFDIEIPEGAEKWFEKSEQRDKWKLGLF